MSILIMTKGKIGGLVGGVGELQVGRGPNHYGSPIFTAGRHLLRILPLKDL